MKSIYSLSLFLVIGLILAGCGGESDNDENANATKQDSKETSEVNVAVVEGEDSDLTSGVNTVITSLKQLDSDIENTDDVNTINESGKTLEEDWDRIEKKVEEKFPDQYIKIEETLYPLIAEAKKEEPDIKKMKEWIQTTLDSIDELKESLGSL
ncbi:hypothetical protein [Oceanobacillus senegalensis]|uniref:hypothetical protein n=1 Tax=Oceanobacillus senegalensis TaxID=1936063 RepID=UPI000A310AF3|nr:hypothetical protein [Oceanobacillus senegalensis]